MSPRKNNLLLISFYLGLVIAPINAAELSTKKFFDDCSIGYQLSNITGDGISFRKNFGESSELQSTILGELSGKKVDYDSGKKESFHNSKLGIGLAYRNRIYDHQIVNKGIFTNFASGLFVGGSAEIAEFKKLPLYQQDHLLRKGAFGSGIYLNLCADKFGIDVFSGLKFGYGVERSYDKAGDYNKATTYALEFGYGLGVYYNL